MCAKFLYFSLTNRNIIIGKSAIQKKIGMGVVKACNFFSGNVILKYIITPIDITKNGI